ncbi:hypothetical protein KGF54_001429 [Candida jiufengensis]|uniref:uncharacterized protein n=1 Tax=Candida jiufengensis TaxID=497108 RepID=UPI002224CD70|nr:uncharacterized protein KGF54_001429 [Candida jiufengensis]KAI5955927.1 hypothetical protein KGF54_001429 [Candida jiufengensis]
MIRGNWSLAQEFKQNERKQQSKIQQRQKNQFKLEKLKNTDPIKLFHKIENLKNNPSKTEKDEEYLTKLQEDWSFIEKNGLHQSKVKQLLSDHEKKLKLKQKQETKLWGQESIYFNPELNPLGKVPDLDNLKVKLKEPLKNLIIKNLKNVQKYEPDSLIKELNIKLPKGEPPKFYKYVQNTKKAVKKKQVEEIHEEIRNKENDASDVEDEEEEEEQLYKKQKLG